MKAYSMDLRERVLKDCDAGLGTWAVSLKYAVSPAWIRRLKQRRRETGELNIRSSRNRRQARWLSQVDALQEAVATQPDITLRELRDKLNGSVSIQTLSRALRQLGLTRKKRAFTRLSKTIRTSPKSVLAGV